MILSSATLTGVTAKPSLIEDIDFFVNTDSNSYPLADKLRNINTHYYDVVSIILGAQSNWEWDDTNNTDYPIGTTNLVADQRDYSLPSDFIKLLRVEILDASGSWRKLDQIDESQISSGLASTFTSNGTPQYYREIGNSIELYPKASSTGVTLTAGLKIYTQRLPPLFTTSSAGTSPGFDARFHRILSYGAAYDYACAKSLPQANTLLQKKMALEALLREAYADRNREVAPMIRPRPQNYD